MVNLNPKIEFEVQAHMEKSQIKVTIPPALWKQRYVDGTPIFDITKKIHVAITQEKN